MSGTKRILITDEIHPYLKEQFVLLGFEVDVELKISPERLLEIIEHYSVVVITTYLKIDQKIINNAKNLKAIARVGSGLENVDVQYAESKGIKVINSPEGNANAVGEHTLALLLNLLNKINTSNQALKNNIWNREQFRGTELDGKTVGIVGFGHTGAAFAKKLLGFDVEILVSDILPNKHQNQVEIIEIQKKCDIISFHVPHTSQTHQMVDALFLKKCDKNPIILNTSRGAVVDTKAIVEALYQNQIKGLGIDVYEDEPIFSAQIQEKELYEKLIQLDNVIATPHIAGWTVESKYKLVKILFEKLIPIIQEKS